MYNLYDLIFGCRAERYPIATLVWHDDTPRYIKKRQQGIVLPHEAEHRQKLDKVRIVTLLHRKIAPLGRRPRHLWETWYLVV